MSDLGDRMKANYEKRGRRYLLRRVPVIVRVDGRAFHSWTRGLGRPFDLRLIATMVRAATELAADMQGCKAAYIQSDEASFLLTDFDRLNTEAWFDYCQNKVESIAAAVMTARFNEIWGPAKRPAIFDARAFNIPEAEVANYFLWRAKDWERNSVSMYCHAHFSHKQMHGKGRSAQHDMLHSIGKNWATDLDDQIKNGTWLHFSDRCVSESHAVPPVYDNINTLLQPLMERVQ